MNDDINAACLSSGAFLLPGFVDTTPATLMQDICGCACEDGATAPSPAPDAGSICDPAANDAGNHDLNPACNRAGTCELSTTGINICKCCDSIKCAHWIGYPAYNGLNCEFVKQYNYMDWGVNIVPVDDTEDLGIDCSTDFAAFFADPVAANLDQADPDLAAQMTWTIRLNPIYEALNSAPYYGLSEPMGCLDCKDSPAGCIIPNPTDPTAAPLIWNEGIAILFMTNYNTHYDQTCTAVNYDIVNPGAPDDCPANGDGGWEAFKLFTRGLGCEGCEVEDFVATFVEDQFTNWIQESTRSLPPGAGKTNARVDTIAFRQIISTFAEASEFVTRAPSKAPTDQPTGAPNDVIITCPDLLWFPIEEVIGNVLPAISANLANVRAAISDAFLLSGEKIDNYYFAPPSFDTTGKNVVQRDVYYANTTTITYMWYEDLTNDLLGIEGKTGYWSVKKTSQTVDPTITGDFMTQFLAGVADDTYDVEAQIFVDAGHPCPDDPHAHWNFWTGSSWATYEKDATGEENPGVVAELTATTDCCDMIAVNIDPVLESKAFASRISGTFRRTGTPLGGRTSYENDNGVLLQFDSSNTWRMIDPLNFPIPNFNLLYADSSMNRVCPMARYWPEMAAASDGWTQAETSWTYDDDFVQWYDGADDSAVGIRMYCTREETRLCDAVDAFTDTSGGSEGYCTESCFSNSACGGSDTCCWNGCGHACGEPETFPPTQPPTPKETMFHIDPATCESNGYSNQVSDVKVVAYWENSLWGCRGDLLDTWPGQKNCRSPFLVCLPRENTPFGHYKDPDHAYTLDECKQECAYDQHCLGAEFEVTSGTTGTCKLLLGHYAKTSDTDTDMGPDGTVTLANESDIAGNLGGKKICMNKPPADYCNPSFVEGDLTDEMLLCYCPNNRKGVYNKNVQRTETTAVSCDSDADQTLKIRKALANRMFDMCESWCLFDFDAPLEDAWFWDPWNTCWRAQAADEPTLYCNSVIRDPYTPEIQYVVSRTTQACGVAPAP